MSFRRSLPLQALEAVMESEPNESLRSHVNTTASSARNSAADQVLTTTMHVSSTAVDVEADDDVNEGVLRGLRKRWMKRAPFSDSHQEDECDPFGNPYGLDDLLEPDVKRSGDPARERTEEQDFGQTGPHVEDPVQVVDAAVDERFAPEVVDKVDSPPPSNALQSLSNTRLGVFHFPWGKGRVAVFSEDKGPQAKFPRLSPSGVNPLRVCVSIDEDCKASAEVKVIDERNMKPQRAIARWWQT